MAYGVLIKNRVAAMNVDSINRSASGSYINIENGHIFRLDSQSTTSGSSEVWEISTGTADGSTLDNMWMACSPPVVITNSQYKGLDPDPRNFTNLLGMVLDAFRPYEGDVITLSADAISGSPSTGNYVVVVSGSHRMAWQSAAGSGSSLCLKLLSETYISIGSGAIDSQRVLAYKLQVISN